MFWVILWAAITAGLFLWNAFYHPFIGVRFTEKLLGFPLNGGWLAAAVAIYCLVRWLVRRKES